MVLDAAKQVTNTAGDYQVRGMPNKVQTLKLAFLRPLRQLHRQDRA